MSPSEAASASWAGAQAHGVEGWPASGEHGFVAESGGLAFALIRQRRDVMRQLWDGEVSLRDIDPAYRGDPDMVLLAIMKCPEQLRDAWEGLTADRSFILEVAHRNGEALRYAPQNWRQDRGIMLAAARQNPRSLHLAAGALLSDETLAREVATPAPTQLSYGGECLRLVGPFAGWDMADARARLSMRRGTGNGPVKHRIVAVLQHGFLAFQLVSCIKGADFRIFPVVTDRDEPFKLVRGDAAAVPAAVGTMAAGFPHQGDYNFRISERGNCVVVIYVELLSGAAVRTGPPEGCAGAGGSSRGVAVWYEVDPGARPNANLTIHQFTEQWVWPRWLKRPTKKAEVVRREPSRAAGTGLHEVRLLMDIKPEGTNVDLLNQAFAISNREFKEDSNSYRTFSDLPPDAHIALLVNAAGDATLGYLVHRCLKATATADECLKIVQLAVLERHRGKGLGKKLLQWAVQHAEESGYSTVHLDSLKTATDFYGREGFRPRCHEYDPWKKQLPMEFKFEWRGLPPIVPAGGE